MPLISTRCALLPPPPPPECSCCFHRECFRNQQQCPRCQRLLLRYGVGMYNYNTDIIVHLLYGLLLHLLYGLLLHLLYGLLLHLLYGLLLHLLYGLLLHLLYVRTIVEMLVPHNEIDLCLLAGKSSVFRRHSWKPTNQKTEMDHMSNSPVNSCLRFDL